MYNMYHPFTSCSTNARLYTEFFQSSAALFQYTLIHLNGPLME